MVIRALYDYEPQGPGELSFSKGDFFHVISNEQDSEWFEAFNPLGNVRGMVPVPYFEILNKKEGISSSSDALLPEERKALHRSSQSKHAQHSPQQVLANGLDISNSMQNLSLGGASGGHTREPSMAGASDRSSQGKNIPSLYGVVLYDFQAERDDELQASKGDAIIVIAQSNHEWFVAKPIGRLGGPGLIPVSFVEIRQMASGQAVVDVEAAVRAAGVPKVEEWKKMAADYKASSITLGIFDDPQKDAQHQQHQHQHQLQAEQQRDAQREAQRAHFLARAPGPVVVAARVETYKYSQGKFWYLVNAELEDGTVRRLCRYYQDFYMFQHQLLETFEAAAGKIGGHPRMLPYIPGPLTHVNDSISSQRRAALDVYVERLVTLPPEISHSVLIQEMFALRPGDVAAAGPTDESPQPPTPAHADSIDVAPAETPAHASYSSVSYSEGTEDSRPVSSASGLMGPPASTGPSGGGGGGHARMTSVSTVGPTPDNPAVNTPQSSSNSVKVKVHYQDDLIAIRVPSDIDYATLHDRLCERLRVDALGLEYKADDGGWVVMGNDDDLGGAVFGRNKLVLRAS